MKKLAVTILILLVGTAINASAIPRKSADLTKKAKKAEITEVLKALPDSQKVEKEKKLEEIKIDKKIFTEVKKTDGVKKQADHGLAKLIEPRTGTSVPDGGATVALLGMALIGLAITRRSLRRIRA